MPPAPTLWLVPERAERTGAEEQPQPGPTPSNLPREPAAPGPPQLWATRRPRPAREGPLAKATASAGTHPVVGPLSLSQPRSPESWMPLPHLFHPAGLSLKDPRPAVASSTKDPPPHPRVTSTEPGIEAPPPSPPQSPRVASSQVLVPAATKLLSDSKGGGRGGRALL